MRWGARRVFSLAVVYGLLSMCARAQEAPDEEAKQEKQGEVAERGPAGPEPALQESAERVVTGQVRAPASEDEKVILSPWRVGDVKGEERKQESRKRRERVLRKEEKQKRVMEHRKKRAQARAKRVKRETNLLYPTNY